MSEGGAVERWRAHQRGSRRPDISIGLAATFTSEALAPFLGAALLDEGLAPAIRVAPFNQLLQVCLDPAAHLPDSDVIVLLWRCEDLIADEPDALSAGGLTRACEKLDELAAAIVRLRERFAGTVIVSLPPALHQLSSVERDTVDDWKVRSAFHHQLWTGWQKRLRELDRVEGLDLDAVLRRVGEPASFDCRRWYLYRQPFTDRFLQETGTALARLVRATRVAPRKCVVLDCDRTLWGGVVGEDGLDGLELGDEFPGSAYRDFQRLLLAWRDRGVLLALLSRNNEADVWEVFERHDGMILKREHLSAWRIDWSRKADNLPLIAEELRISPSAMIFIDDSPFEIEQMRAAWPEVESLLCPEDPADLAERFHGLRLLDNLHVTEEDRWRGEMLAAERARRAAAGDDLLETLQLEIEVFAVESQHLGRVAQLINKTNQFNLTTLRRSQDEVAALWRNGDFRLRAARVRDRFGDYGLTAVAILEVGERGWVLDTFLMSCRVLGRSVESAFLHCLIREAAQHGAGELGAAFVPTAKNAPCATFLPAHGFIQQPDGRWRLRIDQAPVPPARIRIDCRVP